MKWYQKALAGSAGVAGAGVVAWKTLFPWLEYDLQLISVGKKLLKVREEAMQTFLIDKFEEQVVKHPKKPFVIFEDNIYTYEFVDQMACKVANVAKALGLKLRDCVAMMIENEPAFVWTFLGLQKIGVTVAFINHNLKMHPLVHSVKAADPKYLIVGSGEHLTQSVLEVLDDLGKIPVYIQGLGTSVPPHSVHSFDVLMQEALPTPIYPAARAGINMDDVCCYIYTSGTTGNPKAAYINYKKMSSLGILFKAIDISSSDIIYAVLPLYHSAGEIGLGGAIFSGATMVLRRKFSARHFMEDCRKYNVTVIQYIGELFRYLLAQPPNDLDKQHLIRAAFGNGLRKDIWEEVNNRFKIPKVVEFFGATEGTTMLLNLANRPGAIGRLSPFMNAIDPDPKYLVKFDYGTALPLRDRDGRCIKVAVGEPGLFISKVPELMLREGTLKVYRSSDEANEKKLVRDAFQPGDIYFNYGDVMVQDRDYFLYFQDRIGDTFRWKGENVSTTELANVITALPFIDDANVYGVTMPGSDGRAGMAAITVASDKVPTGREMKDLYDHVCEELPSYARPLFIRHLREAIITGTFKQRKVDLVKEGYDLNLIKDPMYFLDSERKTYTPLTTGDLAKFLSSKL